MTTAVNNANGRVRKSLASQIDRLDSILTGLSEALTESVAEAVERGVAKVLTELLTNPALAERIRMPTIPPGEDEANGKTSPPSSGNAPTDKPGGVFQTGYRQVKQACSSVLRQASRLAGSGQPFLSKLLGSRLLACVGALGVVGLITVFAGPKVPFLITAAVGWITAVITRARASFRRTSLGYASEPR